MSIEDRTFYSIETPLFIETLQTTFQHPEQLITLSGQLQLNARDGEGELAIVETFDLIQTYEDEEGRGYNCIGCSDNGYYVEIYGSWVEGDEHHELTLYSPDYFDEISGITIANGSTILENRVESYSFAFYGFFLDGFDRSVCNFNVAAETEDSYTEPANGVCFSYPTDVDVNITVLSFPGRTYLAESEDMLWWTNFNWDDISGYIEEAPTWDDIIDFCKDGNRYHLKFDFIRPINKVKYGDEVLIDLTDPEYPLADMFEVAGDYEFIDKSGAILPGVETTYYPGDVEADLIYGQYNEIAEEYIDSISADPATWNVLLNVLEGSIASDFIIANKVGRGSSVTFSPAWEITNYSKGGYRKSNLITARYLRSSEPLGNGMDICGMYGGEYLGSVQYIGNHQIRAFSTTPFEQEINEDGQSILSATQYGNPGIWAATNKLNDYLVVCYPTYV